MHGAIVGAFELWGLRGKRVTHVALTGASSGIGAALALQYAKPGSVLSLFARRERLLDDVATACRQRGAKVQCCTGDVTESSHVTKWYADSDNRLPIDLIIANAGIFGGHGPTQIVETDREAERLVTTNLLGAIYTAQAAIPRMMARRHGHVAFVSSLAARLPAADAPTYSATKAGVAAYAEALREYLLDYNICVSTIFAGHVQTAQTDLHLGPLSLIIPVHEAARRIHTGLEQQRATIALPRRAALLVSAARLLPWRIRARANAGSRFRVRK